MVSGSLRLLPPLKNGDHDIAEILLKVALNTKNQKSYYILLKYCLMDVKQKSIEINIS
jgi:hypothetical protein